MPKRRMTVARRLQIREWQMMGRKVRAMQKARTVTGKNVLLIHRTSHVNTANILANQRFNDLGGKTWFYPYQHRHRANNLLRDVRAGVSVTVPRKHVIFKQKVKTIPAELIVKHENLVGRKIRSF